MLLSLTDLPGVGPATAEALNARDIGSVKKLSKTKLKDLTRVPGIGEATGQRMIQAAKDLRAQSKAEKKRRKK